MTEEIKRKKTASERLLVLAAVFLTNPVVNIFDYLPDVIGYFIIFKALEYFAERSPYFDEAQDGFKKLFIVSLFKIPSYFIMVHARGQNTMDYDVKSLFTFTFTVIEVWILIFAVKNLFKALFYLGERSDARALLSTFPISKNGKRSFSPEKLELFTYVFIIYKGVATALPEMLLLTRIVSSANAGHVFNVASLYPYTIIFAVVSVFVLGVILSRRYKAYIRSIDIDASMRPAADNMLDKEKKERLATNLMVNDIRATLSVFIVGAFLMIDICFDNLYEINLLPQLLFGAICVYGIWRLSRYSDSSRSALYSGIAYTLLATVSFAFQVEFLNEFGYSELINIGGGAKEAYMPVMITAAIEFVALAVFFSLFARNIISFSDKHTGIDAHNERYSRMDAEFHKTLRQKAYIFAAFGILAGATKLLEIIFRYFPNITYVSNDSGSWETGVVVSGLVPWFSVAVLASSVLYICYCIHFFGKLREEVEIKYS